MSRNIEKYNSKSTSFKLHQKTMSFVIQLLNTQLTKNHFFHNWNHTFRVVQGVEKIADKMEITVDEKEIICLAAWFHDTGHTKKCYGHEEESKKIARDFLLENKYPLEKIARVLECIDATKIPQEPKDLLGKILCDGDLFHLSSSNYLEHLQNLRMEWALISNINFSERKWLEMNINFLKTHQYFTSYGKEILEKGKQKNIDLVRNLRLKLIKG